MRATAVVKAAGTVLVSVLLTQPLWAPEWGSGVLGEVAAPGLPGAVAAVAVFFGLVALYCRSLQRTLHLVPPRARAAAPRSVWWMFAIPCNFTEDFFIVRAVAVSLASDGRTAPAAVRRWQAVGFAWCGLQIVSLLPGAAGRAGAVAALLLWAAHWAETARLNRRLAAGRPAALQPRTP
ncbi:MULTISPECIES: hypothetical protein [Streptomyces]|uniref:hypothetical protein n=1 Tax=Streptomyces TaxID=1883 RepID=UPI001679C9BE|nr:MULTISPECIES: hypothetical protein [Streptomyces]MBD3575668.1 hypothetical protein [Streptomyces sp. KD18]